MNARFELALAVAWLSLCSPVSADDPTSDLTPRECRLYGGSWREPPGECVLGFRTERGEYFVGDGERVSSQEFSDFLNRAEADEQSRYAVEKELRPDGAIDFRLERND